MHAHVQSGLFPHQKFSKSVECYLDKLLILLTIFVLSINVYIRRRMCVFALACLSLENLGVLSCS